MDTWDALTTERPYRPTGSVEEALETLRDERGMQFDPQVLDAFLDAIDEALEIRERFPVPGERPAPAPPRTRR